MAEYSREELEKMQREAEKRVADMQSRARKNLNWENFGRAPLPDSRNRKQPERQHPADPYNQPARQQDTGRFNNQNQHTRQPENNALLGGLSGGLSNLLSGPMSFLERFNLGELIKDSDTALIIAMLLLVGRKDADPLLTLALIYIMM